MEKVRFGGFRGDASAVRFWSAPAWAADTGSAVNEEEEGQNSMDGRVVGINADQGNGESAGLYPRREYIDG